MKVNEPLFSDMPESYSPVRPMASDRELTLLGETLPKEVFLGTSSWNFSGWRGLVYSETSEERRLANEGLAAYSAYPIFRTVGIDRSFYLPVKETQLKRYAEAVPDVFRFCVKAPQTVCDPVIRDRFGRMQKENPYYLDFDCLKETFLEPVCAGLKDRLGPIVLEFPPIPMRFLGDLDAKHRAIETLTRFLGDLPKEKDGKRLCYMVEMRTRAIYTPRFIDALRETGVRLSLGVHHALPPIGQQILALRRFDAPEVKSGPWNLKGDVLVRWSLSTFGTYAQLKKEWAPFHTIQSPDIVTRESIAWILALAKRSNVKSYALANNKAEGCAPLTMRAIAKSVIEKLKKNDGC